MAASASPLAILTILIASATLVTAAVPAILHGLDERNAKRAGRKQIEAILEAVKTRIQTLARNPRFSKETLRAGLDLLFTRSLQSDFARVFTREEIAAERQRTLDEAVRLIISDDPQEKRKAEEVRENSDAQIKQNAADALAKLDEALKIVRR